MNVAEVMAQLQREFPGKEIICIPPDKPTEMVVESRRAPDGSESTAVAMIWSSLPHVHHQMTERYKVGLGSLTVYIDGRADDLYEGQEVVIKPGQVHWAEGEGTRVLVVATPAWTADDHILVPDAPVDHTLFEQYRQFNRDFRLANPGVQCTPPSWEGFEHTMRRLATAPVIRRNLIRMWWQGWAATQAEMDRRNLHACKTFIRGEHSRFLKDAIMRIMCQQTRVNDYI